MTELSLPLHAGPKASQAGQGRSSSLGPGGSGLLGFTYFVQVPLKRESPHLLASSPRQAQVAGGLRG